MAITFDNSFSWSLGGGPNTTSYTVTGTDPYVFVAVASQNRTGQTIGTIKYNGVDLTQLITRNDSLSGNVELWGLVGPASGSHNMVITWTAQADIAAGCIASYAGVHQTTPLGTAVSNNSTTAGPGLGSAAGLVIGVDEWGVVAIEASGVTFTAGAGDNDRVQNANKPRLGIVDSTAVSVTYTASASVAWAAVGVPLKPSGAAAAAAAGHGALLLGQRNRVLQHV